MSFRNLLASSLDYCLHYGGSAGRKVKITRMRSEKSVLYFLTCCWAPVSPTAKPNEEIFFPVRSFLTRSELTDSGSQTRSG